MPQAPIVLVGPLRGGSTLLRLMLAHHPEIQATGEFEEAVSQAGDSGWPDPQWFCQWLSQDRMALTQGYEIPEHPQDYPSIVQSMWSQLVKRHPGTPVCVCTIHSRFDRVREIWPDARFIFQTRDPRDVANSCVRMGWAGEPTSGAATWIDPTRRWLALRETLPETDFIEVRYEDLITNPEHELARCCDFVGLAFDAAMLEFHQTTTYGKIDPGLAEQWRKKLSPRQCELIELKCGDLMHRFGYEPSSPNPKAPGTLERIRLRISNKLRRYGFRMKRFGPVLTIGWTVVQHLPLKNPARGFVQARLNRIETRHLK